MNTNLIKLFFKLFYSRKNLLKKGYSIDEIARINFLILLITFTASSLVVYVLMNMSSISYSIFAIYLSLFMVLGLLYFLIYKEKFHISKLILSVMGNIFLFIKASSFGQQSGIDLVLMLNLYGTFSFFSIREYKYIIFTISVTILGFALLHLTHYSLLPRVSYDVSQEYFYNLWTAIIIVILITAFLMNFYTMVNSRLQKVNNRLTKKNQNLFKINSELDNYLYKASHDLRAPLTSMLGIVNLSKKEKDPVVLEEYLDLQEQCIKKLDDHIQQILNLSKNVKTRIAAEQISFKCIIHEVFEELSFYEDAFRTRKTINITGSGDDFFSDRYRLKIIFNNLISNALRYSSGNPDAEISIHILISKHEAKITVRDNGQGIPSKHLDKIFEMFYRATERSSGSGLGLYIVKEMIDKLGGKIQVESEPGKFTEISFSLPNLQKKS